MVTGRLRASWRNMLQYRQLADPKTDGVEPRRSLQTGVGKNGIASNEHKPSTTRILRIHRVQPTKVRFLQIAVK